MISPANKYILIDNSVEDSNAGNHEEDANTNKGNEMEDSSVTSIKMPYMKPI